MHRWHEFSGQSLMQLALGFAGLRVCPSAGWLERLAAAAQAVAARGDLSAQQAGAISQALGELQALPPVMGA